MGEAKRRKATLGDRYGKKADLPIPGKLTPDYGSYYVETMGVTPFNVWIANPQVITGRGESNINWNAHGYLATLIVSPEFAEAYKQNPSQMLRIVPDPDDAYVTPLGERVVPFKLVEPDVVPTEREDAIAPGHWQLSG